MYNVVMLQSKFILIIKSMLFIHIKISGIFNCFILYFTKILSFLHRHAKTRMVGHRRLQSKQEHMPG